MTELQYIAQVALPRQVRVVDGDTFWLHMQQLYRQLTHVEFRLAGWDCPETRAPMLAERAKAREATAYTTAWFLAHAGDRILIRSEKDTEKYGRWLGHVWAENAAGETTGELGSALGNRDLAVLYPGKWRDTYL